MPDRSDSDQVALSTQPLVIKSVPLGRLTIVRLFRPSDEDVRGVSNAFGFELPVEPNVISTNGIRAMRLAPEEWWILDGLSAAEITARLAPRHHLANDATAGKLAWIISGSRASDLLNCGCSLALHERAFPPGRCARTIIAGVSAVILCWAEPLRFEVIVDRSLGEYFRSWLADAQKGFAA